MSYQNGHSRTGDSHRSTAYRRDMYLPDRDSRSVYATDLPFTSIPRPKVQSYMAPRRQSEPTYESERTPNTAAATNKVDTYFSFLEEVRSPDEEVIRYRPQSTRYSKPELPQPAPSPESPANRAFAIIFSVVLALLGTALLAYGIWRTDQLATGLVQPSLPLYAVNASDLLAADTASACLQLGLWTLVFAILGITGFASSSRGLKLAYLLLSPLPTLLALYTIHHASREIGDRYRKSSLDTQDVVTFSSVTGLGCTAIFLLVVVGSVQAAFGTLNKRRRPLSWDIALLCAATLLAASSTALLSLAILALTQSLDPGIGFREWVYTGKRDVSVGSGVCGLYCLCISFLALAAVFRRSRPIALATAGALLAPLFYLTKTLLSIFFLLTPAIVSVYYKPTDIKEVFYALLGLVMLTEVSALLVMCLAAIAVFRR